MMAKYTLKQVNKKRYHRDSAMSKAEIILIMTLFHDSDYRCLKHFFLENVSKHLCHLFPEVVSYYRFVELEKEVAIPLSRTGVKLEKTKKITNFYKEILNPNWWSFYLAKAYFYKVKAMLWGRKSYALTR